MSKRRRHWHYILAGREAVPADMSEYETEFVRRCRLAALGGVDPWRVAHTDLGKSSVSTVFLGINHNPFDGPPMIFETMIFGGRLDHFQNRCSTWDEAEVMHDEAVKLARGAHLKVVK